MNPTEIINAALSVGITVARTISAAIQAGDVSTLEALSRVLPAPEVLKARDMALREQQRKLAENELGK